MEPRRPRRPGAWAHRYVDYYYFIFSIVLLLWMGVSLSWPMHVLRTPLSELRRRLAFGLIGAATIGLSIAVVIWSTSGTTFHLFGREISATSTFNLRQIAWMLVAGAALTWYAPRLRWTQAPAARLREGLSVLLTATVVLGVILPPLIFAAYQTWANGDYVTPHYHWRSAPPGVDLAGLVLGNPIGAIWGGTASAGYAALGIDPVENAIWLGCLPTVLLFFALRRLLHARTRTRDDGRWLGVLALFGIWSLGPYLMLFGANTAWMLPQTALRFLPVLSNARMPGRAFAVMLLAIAVLATMEIARQSWFRRRARLSAALALLAVDFWPTTFPTVSLETPAWVSAFARLPRGVVMDVPLGLRDGFGTLGALDHHTLIYQTMHGQPMAGGFVARLSPRVRAAYERDPVFGRILELSNTASLSKSAAPTLAATASRHICAIRYISMATDVSPDLRAFVDSTFVLRLLVRDRSRHLYAVDGTRGPFCAAR